MNLTSDLILILIFLNIFNTIDNDRVKKKKIIFFLNLSLTLPNPANEQVPR